MATQSISQVVQHSAIPNVSPIAIRPVQQVTQLELAALLSLRNRARQLEAQIADAEKSVRDRLEAGGKVEAGEHVATLKESFRRNVSWRDVAERLAAKLYGPKRAQAYCENVLQNTKAARTVSLAIL